jgi:hypothetical protein
MPFICKICQSEPNSHSFSKIKDEDNISVFYTCPAKSIKHDDHDGIMQHYTGMMDEHGDKPWIWIFDSIDFSIKHAMEIKIAISLAKLINYYSKNLKKIVILNPTWHIHVTLKLVLPFLSNDVKKLIKIDEKNSYE